MSLSPFEERYKTEMNEIFDDSNKLRKWMEVEVALAQAHAELGDIPEDAPEKIRAGMEKVSVVRIHEIESQIHHDLMAMVKALTEQCGDSGRYVHLGATSYDIEDTATALLFVEGIGLLESRIERLQETLSSLAERHRNLVCIGRSHGQHAVPTTYGMKFALYFQELKRDMERLQEARKRIAVGKMSGAVGTMATFGERGPIIQKLVMEKLGLKPAPVTTQVIQRDRHAEIISIFALTAALCEKMAKEVRNLQRTEIAEVAEGFGEKQVGSSTMPHKRNPHKSERVCSLARILRGNLATAVENISLEHERDLTNSANERAIFGESFVCLDYMLIQSNKILSELEFFPENIRKNLEATKGLIMAERLMMHLTSKGMGRQDAHEKVRNLSVRAMNGGTHLRELVVNEGLLSFEEARDVFDYDSYTGSASLIIDEAIGK